MGKTMYQKIVDSNLLEKFPSGEMALKLDWVWGNEITTPNAILDMEKRGLDVVFDSNKIKMMIDHVSPAKDSLSAVQGKIMRDFSRRHGIEFADVGNNGVCHALIPERAWIMPGQIGIMGDSHTCTHGAMGAFTAGVGTTELENGMITGIWICPPQKVIRVNFNGELPANVYAKDLILFLLSVIGVKGATNAVLEFGGNVIAEMGMEGRMTIANMAIEAGATCGMMLVDEKTIKYLWPELHKRYGNFEAAVDNFSSWNSDFDAKYDQMLNFDVMSMAPYITHGYSPDKVTEVAGLAGTKIDQVYIGSCTNGRLSDLRIAAGIFEESGKNVSNQVRCIIVPATQHIYNRALETGLLEIFVKHGCHVAAPSCGACLGMSCGVLAPGEVCLSTTNRNFAGRMGKGGMVHLASPATAAFSAIKGVITKPDISLCDYVANKYYAKDETAYLSSWESRVVAKPDYKNLIGVALAKNQPAFSGRVFYLPLDNVNTDMIIPAHYLTEVDKKIMGEHCLENAISDSDQEKLRQSKILVAGENFGCGSSREHAVWALEACDIRCVIASSFSRIFENNMFANGLLCITAPKKIIKNLCEYLGQVLWIDTDRQLITWHDKNGNRQNFNFTISPYQRKLIQLGGSVGHTISLANSFVQEGKL